MPTRALPGWTYAMMEPANRAWPAVMGVCKYWRTLICNTPLLWSTITAGDIKWLKLALTRSASAPVDIVLLRREVIPSALPFLSPYLDRIRRLQLTNVMDGDTKLIASFLLETRFPQLEELRIQGFAGRASSLDRDSIVLELDKGLLPSLHTLRLSNAFVPLECPTVSSLRVLDLSRMSLHPCMAAVTLDTFLRALERSTSLQELRFDWGLPFKWRETSNRMVALPVLRSLRIISPTNYESLEPETEETLMTFLRHLRLPLGADIHITADVDREPAGYNFLKLVPQDAECLPILHCATSATLGKVSFRCSAGTGASGLGSLEVELEEAHPGVGSNPQDKLLEDFCTLLSHSPLIKLTIASHTLSQEALVVAFRKFEAISSLEFIVSPGGSNAAIDKLVSALSVVDVPSDASVSLPQLRSLRVVGVRPLLTETKRVEKLKGLASLRAGRSAELEELVIEEKTVKQVGPYASCWISSETRMRDYDGDSDGWLSAENASDVSDVSEEL